MNSHPLIAIFLAIFIDFMAFGLIVPVVPVLFGESNTTIFDPSVSLDDRNMLYGLLMSAFAFGMFIGAPLLGAWSDRVGRKKVLMLTNITNALGYLVFAIGIWQRSLPLLFIGRIIPGLGGSSVFIIQSAIADVSTSKTKTKNLGIVGVAFGVGFIIGAVLGGLLSNEKLHPWFSSELPFLVATCVNVLNLFYIFAFFPKTLKEPRQSQINPFTGFKNIQKAFADPNLKWFYFIIFILTLGFSFFLSYFPVYLTAKFDAEALDIGKAFAWIGIWAAITQGLFLRWSSTRFLPGKIILYTIPFLALAYPLLLLPKSISMIYVLLPVLIIFQSMTFPTTLAVLSNQSGRRVQGETIGINQSMHSMSTSIASFIAAFVVGFGYYLIMVVGLICSLIAYFVYLVYYLKRKKMLRNVLESPIIERANGMKIEQIKDHLFGLGLPYDDVNPLEQEFLVINVRHKVVASAALEKYNELGLLRSVGIDAELQGKGLGKKVIEGIEIMARKAGLKKLYLITETAPYYFSRLGFEILSRAEVPIEIQNSKEFAGLCSQDASVMVLELNGSANG